MEAAKWHNEHYRLAFFDLSCAFSGVQALLNACIVNTQELVRGSSSANEERLPLVTLFGVELVNRFVFGFAFNVSRNHLKERFPQLR